jgi:hypothetical protein
MQKTEKFCDVLIRFSCFLGFLQRTISDRRRYTLSEFQTQILGSLPGDVVKLSRVEVHVPDYIFATSENHRDIQP